MNWTNFLDAVVEKYPQKLAMIEQKSNKRLTYLEFYEEINNWTKWLFGQGVKRGERVVFNSENCLEHLSLFFACAKLGAIFVPMNWRLARDEKLEILDIVKPCLIINNNQSDLEYSCQAFEMREVSKLGGTSPKASDISLKDPLLMLFTSGTTGAPKGVLLHGEMLKINQEQTCFNWELKHEDITLVETPFFHTGGYNVLCLPLLSLGGTVVLAEKFDAENVFKTIEEEKVTVYFGVPTMFQILSEHPSFSREKLKTLRFLVSGGASCPIDLIETYQKEGLHFKQGFGLTEVGPNCFLLKEEDMIRKAGSIGRPMPHTQVKLINDIGEEVKIGEVGEILLSGSHVCAGYYKEEKKFKESLKGHYFCTGDLAKYDDEGFFYIVGRKKDMYISGGENVYPAEVEKQLRSHPEIDDAVVVSIPDPKWGEIGVAYLKAKSVYPVNEIRSFLSLKISRYKHPHRVDYLDSFPLLPNGKINRIVLKEDALMQAKG